MGRADGPATLSAWLDTKDDGTDVRRIGTIPLTETTGYAGAIQVDELKPETRYSFAITLGDSPPEQTQFHTFVTAPQPGKRKDFKFAFGSCFKPANENGGAAFDQLSQEDGIRFMLMIGDQLYADAHKNNSLGKIAVTVDEYRKVYACL